VGRHVARLGTYYPDLYTVSSSAAEQLKPHLVSLLQLLAEVINDNENQAVPFYRSIHRVVFDSTTLGLKTMTYHTKHYTTDEVNNQKCDRNQELGRI
jgi:hypothetical protein